MLIADVPAYVRALGFATDRLPSKTFQGMPMHALFSHVPQTRQGQAAGSRPERGRRPGLRHAVDLGNDAPERGPGCEIPFYLTAHDSRSVLAVKGPLRRSAPLTAPGRSRKKTGFMR